MKRRIHAAAWLALLPVVLLAMLAPAYPSAAASPADRTLAVTALAFSPATVDATAGETTTLTWTITDSNASAHQVYGTVTIRMRGDSPGRYVGVPYEVQYRYDDSVYGGASYVSGTPQRSDYRYTFQVPRYAGARTARWAVTQVTATDDQGGTLTAGDAALRRFTPVVTATESVDATPAVYDSLQFYANNPSDRPYVYDNGSTPATMTYSLDIQDQESGFWKGSIMVTGPGATVLTAGFQIADLLGDPHCGNGSGGGRPPQDAFCTVTVTIPPGSPTGTWRVSAVKLVNNAGVTKTYGGLDALPFTLTRNATITAANFAVTPNPVNNWVDSATTQLTFTASGADQGISAVYVDAGRNGGYCPQTSTTPTTNADGTVSIPIRVGLNTIKCAIDGVAIVDGAGNVSVYGNEYRAPDIGVTITRIPDTTPPTATAASLGTTTLPVSQTGSGWVDLYVDVVTPVAPVDQFSTTLYDSAGNVVTSAFGGLISVFNGQAVLHVYPRDVLPGTYTVGFELDDSGGLRTTYGPGGLPVPGGPLILTITDG